MAGVLVMQLTANTRTTLNFLFFVSVVLLILGCTFRKGWADAIISYEFVEYSESSLETSFKNNTHGCPGYTATNQIEYGLFWRSQFLRSDCPYLESSQFSNTLYLSYSTWHYFNPSQYNVILATQILYMTGFVFALISYALYQHGLLIDDK